jgi:uncharacterized SAM-binding protein YcdF (DUF218 family)
MIRRRLPRVLLLLGIVVYLLWAFQSIWMPPIGGFLIVSDPLQQADAVMPLASGTRRLQHAAHLIDTHHARWFVLSNAFTDDAPDLTSVQRRNQAIEAGVRGGQIMITPNRVTSTYEEAMELRMLATENQWERVIVVTDPFHTRRARLVFRDVFANTEIGVIIRPVEQHWYEADSWWEHGHDVLATALEYIKLVSYILGYRSTGELND